MNKTIWSPEEEGGDGGGTLPAGGGGGGFCSFGMSMPSATIPSVGKAVNKNNTNEFTLHISQIQIHSTYIHTHAHTHTHKYTHTRTHAPTHPHTRTRARTHTHTHTHVFTHGSIKQEIYGFQKFC